MSEGTKAIQVDTCMCEVRLSVCKQNTAAALDIAVAALGDFFTWSSWALAAIGLSAPAGRDNEPHIKVLLPNCGARHVLRKLRVCGVWQGVGGRCGAAVPAARSHLWHVSLLDHFVIRSIPVWQVRASTWLVPSFHSGRPLPLHLQLQLVTLH